MARSSAPNQSISVTLSSCPLDAVVYNVTNQVGRLPWPKHYTQKPPEIILVHIQHDWILIRCAFNIWCGWQGKHGFKGSSGDIECTPGNSKEGFSYLTNWRFRSRHWKRNDNKYRHGKWRLGSKRPRLGWVALVDPLVYQKSLQRDMWLLSSRSNFQVTTSCTRVWTPFGMC